MIACVRSNYFTNLIKRIAVASIDIEATKAAASVLFHQYR